MVINMFNGFRKLNENNVLLSFNNNYKFNNDLDYKSKEKIILNETKKFIINHNINFNKKILYVYNGIIIGYINKTLLNK